MTPEPKLLGVLEVDEAELIGRFSPRLADANKRVLYEGIARSPAHSGRIRVARYRAGKLPQRVAGESVIVRCDEPFQYDNADHFHLNFANAHLFCAYGAAGFAQDEIQVAEHPALASLREALLAEPRPGLAPLTFEDGMPTPVLILNVECRANIDLDPELAFPFGIYGRRFARASPEAIRQAVLPVSTPRRSNIIAIAAPESGGGRYTREQIETILLTVHAGFRAACLENDGKRAVVHTGHWGTGAHAGDRVLTAALQLVAARTAGVETLWFHSLDTEGAQSLLEAERIAARCAPSSSELTEVIDRFDALGRIWGTSDGN